jgi:hypothetical protein
VTLVDRLPTGGDNFGTDCPASGNDTVFDDASPSPITTGLAPFASTYSPVEPLSAFAGKSGAAVNGVWTLKAADLAEDDTGTIECWTLNGPVRGRRRAVRRLGGPRRRPEQRRRRDARGRDLRPSRRGRHVQRVA